MTVTKAKYIHFIGIGGIGTSSIAQIFNAKGKIVSGSDQTPSAITRSLKLQGIEVKIGHDSKYITKKHQLVIYSPAIPPTNEELEQAKKLKIKTLSYPEALGELTKTHKTIAICGTHGKSTTTAMTSLILQMAGLDPTVVIGTKIKQFKNKNYRVGDSDYLIIEACEYKRSFLHFQPDILVITNLEADHLDYYKDFKDYRSAFEKLIQKVPKDGHIVINQDNKALKEVTKKAKATVTTWKEVKIDELHLKPQVHGNFNLENSKNAATVGKILNIKDKTIQKAINSFKGTWRRMEQKHKKGYKCKFIDDYGHHPTEIELTLNAIRENNPKSKILCVFQPHQYSRTLLLLKEFGKAFYSADKVLIPNIYKVRDSEEDIKKVSAQSLVDEINKNHLPKPLKTQKAVNGESLQKTAEYIEKQHKNFDIIVTMGAGDIPKLYKLI